MYSKEQSEVELDAKMTFGQAWSKQEGAMTTNPMKMSQRFNGVISASVGRCHWGT